MAASHPSLDASEPKGATAIERATETERPSAAPASMTSAAGNARLQAALSATSRADASLSTLMRAVRDLTMGVSSAREANVALVGELGALADLLGAANERQLALKNRIAYLEQSITKAERDSASERAYILEQQDAFIAGMYEDHEHAVAELRRELETTRERLSQRPTANPGSLADFPVLIPPVAGPPTEPAPAPDGKLELESTRRELERLLSDRERTRETLLKLQAQRDEAQATVVRLTRERDLARSEGAQTRIGDAVRQAIPVHTPTPTPAGRMASTLPPPESPRQNPQSSPSHSIPSAKPVSSRKQRTTEPAPKPRIPSPPPEELRAAIHPPSTPLPPAPLLTPAPLTPRGPEARLAEPAVPTIPPASQKAKPEPSIRPGGGYSLTNSVAPERVNTSVVSRPPRR